MKPGHIQKLTVAALMCLLATTACKSKKVLIKSPETVDVPVKAVMPPKDNKDTAEIGTPTPVITNTAPVVEQVDYKSFANLQFEFNSAILKTSSYPMLDKVSREMKKNTTMKFKLNGYASAEGTPAHNMELSEQRASAVKTYLLNAGVTDSQLSVKGYGEANPIKPNTTDENKALNRRVEIRL